MDIDLKEEIRKQDELLAEYLRVIEIQKGLIQELKKMEKRALDAEKQQDDALDKAKEIRLQYYETAAELEEERGKTLNCVHRSTVTIKTPLFLPLSRSNGKRSQTAGKNRTETGRSAGASRPPQKKTGTHTAGHPSSCTGKSPGRQ